MKGSHAREGKNVLRWKGVGIIHKGNNNGKVFNYINLGMPKIPNFKYIKAHFYLTWNVEQKF